MTLVPGSFICPSSSEFQIDFIVVEGKINSVESCLQVKAEEMRKADENVDGDDDAERNTLRFPSGC